MPYKIIKCTCKCVDQLKLCLTLFCLSAFNSVYFRSTFIPRPPEMPFTVGCRKFKVGCFLSPGCQVAFQQTWPFQRYLFTVAQWWEAVTQKLFGNFSRTYGCLSCQGFKKPGLQPQEAGLTLGYPRFDYISN